MYTIFIRTFYKEVTDRYGRKSLELNPRARRTILGYANTQDKAREMCKQYNDTHKPGKLSRKAEYTSDF